MIIILEKNLFLSKYPIYFSNSSISHEENTKDLKFSMSVWKSDEKLLIFASIFHGNSIRPANIAGEVAQSYGRENHCPCQIFED